jgi:protein involved in polysaccharide export with SLBB domain
VSGEVTKSGNVPSVDGLAALQAIAAAGGFTDDAEH